jgi:hypothetical protein
VGQDLAASRVASNVSKAYEPSESLRSSRLRYWQGGVAGVGSGADAAPRGGDCNRRTAFRRRAAAGRRGVATRWRRAGRIDKLQRSVLAIGKVPKGTVTRLALLPGAELKLVIYVAPRGEPVPGEDWGGVTLPIVAGQRPAARELKVRLFGSVPRRGMQSRRSTGHAARRRLDESGFFRTGGAPADP